MDAISRIISNELHTPSVGLGVAIYCTLAAAVLAALWWAWGDEG